MSMNIVNPREALTADQLRRVAPSIFAERPHHAVSERYGFVSTIDALRGLSREGWEPVYAGESKPTRSDKAGFTRHVVRLRHPDLPAVLDESFPELVLTNSHDRSTGYQLSAGLFRLVCSNGLVVSDGIFASLQVYHTRRAVESIIEGSFEVIKSVPKIAGAVTRMAAIQLTDGEQEAFANAAAIAKWGEREGGGQLVTGSQLNRARRDADRAPDLWHTLNRVQENLMQGGLSGRAATGRRVRTRGVKAVAEDLRLNRALFALADSLAAHKLAA